MTRAGLLVQGVLLTLGIAVISCSAGGVPWVEVARDAGSIDVAIITVLPQEYHAVLSKLDRVMPAPVPGGMANAYVWVLGEVDPSDGGPPRRVVVAMAGESGEISGALATKDTIDVWRPRDVMVAGIAGGIPPAVGLGDVVISSEIWGYEHGHLGDRYDSGGLLYFQSDPKLLSAARNLGGGWRQRIVQPSPNPEIPSKVVVGNTASGNKVIENASSRYFASTIRPDKTIVSVEMEGAGAAAAVGRAQDLGMTTGFLMVRSVSDLVDVHSSDHEGRSFTGRNPEREEWKDYAADVAASFAVELIASGWPD